MCEKIIVLPSIATCVLGINTDTFITFHLDLMIKWRYSTEEQLKIVNGHNEWIRNAVKLNFYMFLTCAQDTLIKIWTNDLELHLVLNGHTQNVNSACLITNNEIASCSSDEIINVWV